MILESRNKEKQKQRSRRMEDLVQQQEAQIEQYKAEIDALTKAPHKELTELQEKLKESERKLEESNIERKEETQKTAKLQEQLQDAKDELKASQEETKQKVQELSRIKQLNNQVENKLTQLTEHGSSMNEQLEDLRKQVLEAEERVKSRDDTIQHLKEQLLELQQANQGLEGLQEQMKSMLAETREQRKNANQTAMNLQQKLNKTQQLLEEADGTIFQERNQRMQMEAKIKQLDSRNKALKQHLELDPYVPRDKRMPLEATSTSTDGGKSAAKTIPSPQYQPSSQFNSIPSPMRYSGEQTQRHTIAVSPGNYSPHASPPHQQSVPNNYLRPDVPPRYNPSDRSDDMKFYHDPVCAHTSTHIYNEYPNGTTTDPGSVAEYQEFQTMPSTMINNSNQTNYGKYPKEETYTISVPEIHGSKGSPFSNKSPTYESSNISNQDRSRNTSTVKNYTHTNSKKSANKGSLRSARVRSKVQQNFSKKATNPSSGSAITKKAPKNRVSEAPKKAANPNETTWDDTTVISPKEKAVQDARTANVISKYRQSPLETSVKPPKERSRVAKASTNKVNRAEKKTTDALDHFAEYGRKDSTDQKHGNGRNDYEYENGSPLSMSFSFSEHGRRPKSSHTTHSKSLPYTLRPRSQQGVPLEIRHPPLTPEKDSGSQHYRKSHHRLLADTVLQLGH